MEFKYCCVNEIIRILATKGLNADLETIRSCVRERLIHPIIYIDSFPAYACEIKPDRSARAVGLCFLSAYWNPGDNIIAIFNSLTKKDKVEIAKWINVSQLDDNFEMHSWQNDNQAFVHAPPEFVSPKPFSTQLKIEMFNLLEGNLSLKNIMIATKDISTLVGYLNGLNEAVSQKNKILNKADLSSKEHTSLLNIIAALMKIYFETKKNANQSSLITEITEKYKKLGLSKRNLEKILPKANSSFENT